MSDNTDQENVANNMSGATNLLDVQIDEEGFCEIEHELPEFTFNVNIGFKINISDSPVATNIAEEFLSMLIEQTDSNENRLCEVFLL